MQEKRDDQAAWPDDVNIHGVERAASIVLGAGLVVVASLRRGLLGAGFAAVGGVLLHRGVTGHCPVYAALRISTAHGVRGPVASVAHGQGIKFKYSSTVRQRPELVYQFWRKLDNLPRFLRHVESVEVLDERRSRWRARGPASTTLGWDAEIINDVRDELIAWRTLPGSDVAHAGSVRFVRAVGGHATIVTINVEYHPPAGVVGAFIAGLFGADPQAAVAEDMQRFKELLEVDMPRPDSRRGRLNGAQDLETARHVLQTDDVTKNDA